MKKTVKKNNVNVCKPDFDEEDLMDTLVSYADGLEKVMDKTGMNVDAIEEMALNHNVERCPCCDWWTESHNLIPIDSEEPDGYCDNCRINREE